MLASWRDTHRNMRPSKDDAVPAKITEDGTPTIFSFLTSIDAAMEAKGVSAAKELQSSFDSISLSGPESGESARGSAPYRHPQQREG